MAKNQQSKLQSSKFPSAIELTTIAGKKVLFTLPQLVDLLAETEKFLRQTEKQPNPESNLDLAIALIERFGFREPKHFMLFLTTRKGKDILDILMLRLIELAIQERDLRRNIQLTELMHKRELALLLLSLAYEREKEEEESSELSEKSAQKPLQNATNSVEDHAEHAAEIMAKVYKRNILTYTAAATVLEHELNEKLQASEQLELELTQLEQQIELAREKNDIYQGAMTDQSHLEFCEQVFATTLDTVEPSTATQQPTQQLDEVSQKLDEKLKALKELLDKQAIKIASDVDKYSGDPQKERAIRRFLAENTATNIQLANLRDIWDVVKGNKLLYRADGTRAQTFAEAHFILQKDRKIVKVDQEYYLLPVGVETITELDDEAKEAARQSFLQLRPSLLVVNKLVHHNRELEEAEHQDLHDNLSEKNDNFQQDILLLSKRLQQVQLARLNAHTMLESLPAPSSGISTPHPSRAKPKPNPSGILAKSYLQILRLMSHGRPSPKSIADLSDLAPNARQTLSQLKPGQRMSPKQLQQLERLKIDDVDDYSSTAPSPFRKSPYPYRRG